MKTAAAVYFFCSIKTDSCDFTVYGENGMGVFKCA